ncbi:MAG: RICIN domain-containing protein [Methylacidiphilales bacterium]|nr:RICIN domain-containing protein [Candidatus Methylacidiphilales bacterium]
MNKTTKRIIQALVLVFASLGTVKAQSDINLSGYTLKFQDEFNTVSVTTASPKGSSTWYYVPPYGAAGAYSASQWDAAAFSVSGGILLDKAWLDASSKWHSGNLSSVDTTRAGFSQQWGYFEARCQMPNSGTGAWPGFWLGETNWGQGVQGEEIDIFEWYGVCIPNNQNFVAENTHNWNTDGTQNTSVSYLSAPQTPLPGGAFPWQGYHIYGCLIDPVHLTWYIDGIQVNQIATPTSYITAPFYIMLDYALGGGWPLTGMVNNSTFNVDWVRVYSLPPATLTNGRSYQLEPANAVGMRLDVTGNVDANGTNVEIWTANGSPGQKWTLIDNHDGTWGLAPVCAPSRRLDVTGNVDANGTNVEIWIANGSLGQKWALTDNHDGTYSLTPSIAPSRRLDVTGNGKTRGTNVEIWISNGSAGQKWLLF